MKGKERPLIFLYVYSFSMLKPQYSSSRYRHKTVYLIFLLVLTICTSRGNLPFTHRTKILNEGHDCCCRCPLSLSSTLVQSSFFLSVSSLFSVWQVEALVVISWKESIERQPIKFGLLYFLLLFHPFSHSPTPFPLARKK
jgi:hypothetical protein